MNIVGRSCDYADFLKILSENCKKNYLITYGNNLAVLE